MAQEDAPPPAPVSAPFTTEELRSAVRTLLALAAEYEARHGTLPVPPGMTWEPPPGARFPTLGGANVLAGSAEVRGLADGQGARADRRVIEAESFLATIVARLGDYRERREAAVMLDAVSLVEHAHGAVIARVLQDAKAGKSDVLGDVDWVVRGSMAALPPLPPRRSTADRSAVVVDDVARDSIVRFVAVCVERGVSFALLRTDRADLVEKVALAFDNSAVQDRLERSDYPEAVRRLLRGALPPDARLGASSAKDLAEEVGADPGRDTSQSFDILKNRRRQAARFALTALGCQGDIAAAIDEAEPHGRRPDPRV